MATKTIVVRFEKRPEGLHFTFEPESTGFHVGDTVELVLADDLGDGVRFAVQEPWILAPEDPPGRFAPTRSADGRRVEVRYLGPEVDAVRKYAYHVHVESQGQVYRSDGYPTVNQHPPIGGGGG
ncbi:MAG: hypothetical protein AAGN66_19335 [Acidobacteriota bacterium]